MTFWNYNIIIVIHTWVGCTEEMKNVNFLIWTSGKRGSQLVCCTILISQLSLNVIVQFPDICRLVANKTYFTFWPPRPSVSNDQVIAFCTPSLKRHANSFAAVGNNSMWFCISLTHIVYIATHVHLDKTHKYQQQTSSGLLRLYQLIQQQHLIFNFNVV